MCMSDVGQDLSHGRPSEVSHTGVTNNVIYGCIPLAVPVSGGHSTTHAGLTYITTSALKWNRDIINVISNTCALPVMTRPNVCCERESR